MRPTKLVLVGQMGAGKSTIAQHLARVWPTHEVQDLDAVVVAQGRSIERIFAEDGEAGFRAIEATTLASLLAAAAPSIIATGGGAPCQPGAIALMRSHAVVVWLAVEPTLLATRLAAETAHRPLLTTLGSEPSALEAFLTGQLVARRPFYAQAHLSVDASGLPDEVASRIDLLVQGLVDQPA